VAKKLKNEKIDLIISSDLLRTKQTAEILGKELGVKVIFDKRLRDIKFGVFEGKTLEEYQSFWKSYEEKFRKSPRGGEKLQSSENENL
jgi:broad specificity phosphatase PhoE